MKLEHSLRGTLPLVVTLALAAPGIAAAEPPGPIVRLAADFQNDASLGPTGEIATTLAAGPLGSGGATAYSKTLTIPSDIDVIYVTFSAQGDAHFGSALLMNATVNGALIQPLLGQTDIGGGGGFLQTGWYTLLHLPQAPGVQNCNDGGGGTADCHDNTLHFSGCARLAPKHWGDKWHKTQTITVEINLADLPGGDANFAFYERSTIYVDGQDDDKGKLCTGVGFPGSEP